MVMALAAKSVMWSLFWCPFTFAALRMSLVALSVSNKMIIEMYLKENGEEVEFETLNGIKR